MARKQALFNIKGMVRDLAVSKFNPQYAYENHNIRIAATEDNTTLALVNERGNVITDINWEDSSAVSNYIEGTPIGQEILDNNLILFTTNGGKECFITAEGDTPWDLSHIIVPSEEIYIDFSSDDIIYKFWLGANKELKGKRLFQGRLDFDVKNPIESIGLYENEDLKKVYWVDGKNQPRVINITRDIENKPLRDDSFDFVRKLSLAEQVEISRNLVANGVFAPGTVQYFMTYFDLYGQESNIFYTSPLYYVSYNNRGAKTDDTVGVSFNITVSECDPKFEYLRIYCIERTSVNATPKARKVVDLSIPESRVIYYTDYGEAGATIDPTDLFYRGGKEITASTISQKDNTLFLGDIKIKQPHIPSDVEDMVRGLSLSYKSKTYDITPPSGYYTYDSLLKYDSSKISTFKFGEIYRFGLQFQDIYGNWSEPVWINDFIINPQDLANRNHNGSLTVPYINIVDATALTSRLYNLGYVKARPLIVYPSITDRLIACQGVLCPTVYNVEDRYNKFPDVMSSWFFRPNAPYSTFYDVKLSAEVDWQYDYTATQVMSNCRYSCTHGGSTGVPTELNNIVNKGKWAEFRHNKKIPGNKEPNAEIQCSAYPPEPFLDVQTNLNFRESTDPEVWVSQNKEHFYVDQSVVTLHSPEIEFDKNVRSIDSSGLKLRIIGYVPVEASISDINIQTSTPPLNYLKQSSGDTREEYEDIAPGFYKENISFNYTTGGGFGWKSALSGAYWLDEVYNVAQPNPDRENAGFIVYPWHRSGSLNNTTALKPGETRSAMLSQKKMSILRYSSDTKWLAENSIWSPSDGISGVGIFDSEESTIIKLPEPENSHIGEITYSGNIDKVITIHSSFKASSLDTNLDTITDSSNVGSTSPYYPIVIAQIKDNPDSDFGPGRIKNSHLLFNNPYTQFGQVYAEGGGNISTVGGVVASPICSKDPVSMKYRSTPHAVMALNYNIDRKQVILPTHNNINKVGYRAEQEGGCCPSSYAHSLFWDQHHNDSGDRITGVLQESIQLSDVTTGYLWLAELYNDEVNPSRFGGRTKEAFENNEWLPAGASIPLVSNGTPLSSLTIDWTEGDTYYQRYDCLKTYPYTMEDQNSVTDILSFMVETRVNLDGRYDRNRGQASNLYMSPLNFNLMNDAYSQKNNFFKYRGMNSDKLVLTEFPNTITWSKTKTLGEEIDTWTNVTLASTLDLDGDLGKLRAIRRYNDTLLTFQDNGISQILYNENVQIATAQGIPIEIANSGKVSGKRYISNHIGCTNKWTICSTPNGIYFLDTIRKDFYLYNGQFNNLSDNLGFHSWIFNNTPNVASWSPDTFNSCITLYDKTNGDVLLTTKDTALSYSELLNQFTSFYDYGSTPYFGNLEDIGIAWHINSDGYFSPWLHQRGEYNSFFGEYKPFWTTVIVNEDPTIDKIFNNLEYRADGFNGDTYLKDYSFDTLRTWNEYQEGVTGLGFAKNSPSSLKKKFRIWRANIPRWNVDKNGQEANGRDRMRNPWLYLKLSMESGGNLNTNNKVVLHDLVVDYFE